MEKKPFQPEFYKRKPSQKQIEANRKNGKAGGQVSGIAKGFSAMSPEKAQEIQAKGLATRMKNREKNN